MLSDNYKKSNQVLKEILTEPIEILENQCSKFFYFANQNDFEQKESKKFEIICKDNIKAKKIFFDICQNLNHLNYYIQRLNSPLVDSFENKINEMLNLNQNEDFMININNNLMLNLLSKYSIKDKLNIEDLKYLIETKSPIIQVWYNRILFNKHNQLELKLHLLSAITPKNNSHYFNKKNIEFIYKMRNTLCHNANFLNFTLKNCNDINALFIYIFSSQKLGNSEKEYLINNEKFCVKQIEKYIIKFTNNIEKIQMLKFKKINQEKNLTNFLVYEELCVKENDYVKHFDPQNKFKLDFLSEKKCYKNRKNWVKIRLPNNINKREKKEIKNSEINLIDVNKYKKFLENINEFKNLTKKIIEL